MMRIISVALLVLLLFGPVWAEGTGFDPSTQSLAARQVGLGGTSLLFADDAAGVFANPASLTKLAFPQMIGASRKSMLEETQATMLCWAMPSNWGTFGLGYSAVGTGGSLPTKLDPATNRIIIDPSREAISFGNSVMALSYARDYWPNLSFGGALKIFNQSLSGGFASRGTGTSLDLSTKYQPLSWLSLGANLQNVLGGGLQWSGGGSDKIGGNYKLGCKINVWGSSQEAWKYGEQPLFVGLDLDIPHNSNAGTGYHLGAEYYPQKNLALRGGLGLGTVNSGLSLGIGLVNGGFRFDYAFLTGTTIPGDNPHYFSLSYVGERVQTAFRRLKVKESGIKFFQPRDRLITSDESIAISAEAKAIRVLSQRTVWTVTAVSETFEVRDVTEIEDYNPLYLNGIKLEQVGTVETASPLVMGRNSFQLIGFSSPETLVGQITSEVFQGSAEAHVLRVKPFTDVPLDYWATESIYVSVGLGLVRGYLYNVFKPEKGITRAELVALLVRTLPVKEDELIESADFADVPAESWASKYIAYGAKQKLVSGYPDGKFKPNKGVTRAEGVTVLARYAGLPEKALEKEVFPDVKADFWAHKHIVPAKEVGMLKFLEGKNFEPKKPLTRAEACEILYRTPPIVKQVDDFWNKGIVRSQ